MIFNDKGKVLRTTKEEAKLFGKSKKREVAGKMGKKEYKYTVRGVRHTAKEYRELLKKQ